jgi:DNA invertase Pin-like site-specific DNA recombinase
MSAAKSSSPRLDAIGIVRVSDAGQEDAWGIPRQKTAIAAAVKAHNLNLVRTVVITDVSGRHAEADPDFQKIFADLKKGMHVVLAEQSRLFRPGTFRDYGILEHFRIPGALIFTPTARIDVRTREGRQSVLLNGMMSGEELHTLHDRCCGAKQEIREAGLHPGGNQILPRGVKFIRVRDENGKITEELWKHDGVDSERMRIAYRLLIQEDLPYTHIAEKIGGGWWSGSVKASFMNPIWKGYRLYKYEAKGEEFIPKNAKPDKNGKIKPRRKMTLKPAPELVKIDLPGIVTDEEWARAQEIIAQRETKHRKLKVKNYKRPRHLANGIGYCVCGQALYGRYGSRGPHLDVYACKTQFKGGAGCGMKKVKRTEMDAAIETMITVNLLTANYVIETVELVAEPAAADPGRAQREAALAAVRKARANLLDLRLTGDITKERFVARDRELETEERSLQTLLPMPKPKAKPVDLGAQIAQVFAEFAFLSFPKKRSLLHRAVKEIMLDGRTIPSVTLRGGFLDGVNSSLRSTTQSPIDSLSDVVIRFPKPIEIQRTYVDGRSAGKRWSA